MKYCKLPVVAALLAGGVLAQPIDDAAPTTVTATVTSPASASTSIVSSVPASTVVPISTVTVTASTVVPISTVTASSAPASTVVPTSTVTASSVPASTVVPTSTVTASSAPASTVVPTTTVVTSSVPASTASTTVAAPSGTPTAVTASFDPVYDNANNSLDIVACSNTQALTTATGGKRTFGALPSFPHIGGAFAVTGFGSSGCGTCWAVTFGNTTVNVLAIDVAVNSFNVAQATLDELTGGKAVQLGRVNVTAVQVAASGCGL